MFGQRGCRFNLYRCFTAWPGHTAFFSIWGVPLCKLFQKMLNWPQQGDFPLCDPSQFRGIFLSLRRGQAREQLNYFSPTVVANIRIKKEPVNELLWTFRLIRECHTASPKEQFFYISHSGRVVLVGWVSAVLCDFKVTPKAPVWGDTPLYKPCRYVPPQMVWVWAFPVCKRVRTLSILVWNRVWFSGELRQRVNVFTASIPNK